jgi:hypothetical protein
MRLPSHIGKALQAYVQSAENSQDTAIGMYSCSGEVMSSAVDTLEPEDMATFEKIFIRTLAKCKADLTKQELVRGGGNVWDEVVGAATGTSGD